MCFEPQRPPQELRDMVERVKAENEQLRREQLAQAQQHEEMKRRPIGKRFLCDLIVLKMVSLANTTGFDQQIVVGLTKSI